MITQLEDGRYTSWSAAQTMSLASKLLAMKEPPNSPKRFSWPSGTTSFRRRHAGRTTDTGVDRPAHHDQEGVGSYTDSLLS